MAVINAPLVLSRATSASLVQSTDEQLVTVGNDIPRFDPGLGLLIEGQRTNIVLNSVAGFQGLPPAPNASVATTEISSIGEPYSVRKHTRDNAQVDTNVGVIVAGSTFSLTAGTTYTYSCWVYLPSSQSYGGSQFLHMTSDVPESAVVSRSANFSIRDRWQRVTRTFTSTNTTLAPAVLRMIATTGAFAYSCAPQIEVGPFASQNIITTGTAATRLADLLSTPLSSLGIGSNGACTIVGTFVLSQFASSTEQQFLVQMELDANNRFFVRNSAGTSTLTLQRSTAGSFTEIPTPFSISVGVPVNFAVTCNGAGRVAISVNGSAIQEVTGAPTNYNILNIGSYGGINNLNGYSQVTDTFPYPVSDAVLQQFSAI